MPLLHWEPFRAFLAGEEEGATPLSFWLSPQIQLLMLVVIGLHGCLEVLQKYWRVKMRQGVPNCQSRQEKVHEKFLVNSRRNVLVLLHMVSGSLEIGCFVAALLLRLLFPSQQGVLRGNGYLQALCGACHAVTIFGQIRALFGIQSLMIPAYMSASSLKLLCSVRLALHPHSLTACLQMFIIHTIFAWVRAFYYLFDIYGLCCGCEYTVAVLFAGLVCLPVLGPGANLVAWGAWLGGAAYIARTSPQGWGGLGFLERSRSLLWAEGFEGAPVRCAKAIVAANPELGAKAHPSSSALRGMSNGNTNNGTTIAGAAAWPLATNLSVGELCTALQQLLQDDRFRARLAFAALDTNGDGRLTRGTLRLLLFHWGRHQPMATELLSIVEGQGLEGGEGDCITFKVFETALKPLWWRMAQHLAYSMRGAHLQQLRRLQLLAEANRPRTSKALLGGRSFLSRG